MSIDVRIKGKLSFFTKEKYNAALKKCDESFLIALNESSRSASKTIFFSIDNFVPASAYQEAISLLLEVADTAKTGRVVCQCMEDEETITINANPSYCDSFHLEEEQFLWYLTDGTLRTKKLGSSEPTLVRSMENFIQFDKVQIISADRAVAHDFCFYNHPDTRIIYLDLNSGKSLWTIRLSKRCLGNLWFTEKFIGFDGLVISKEGKVIKDIPKLKYNNGVLTSIKSNKVYIYRKPDLALIQQIDIDNFVPKMVEYHTPTGSILIASDKNSNELVLVNAKGVKNTIQAPTVFGDMLFSTSGKTISVYNGSNIHVFNIEQRQWLELKSRSKMPLLGGEVTGLSDQALIGIRRGDNCFNFWKFNNPNKPKIIKTNSLSKMHLNKNDNTAYCINYNFELVELCQL